MKPTYRQWLEAQKYAANTIAAQLHRAGRVEEYYGDLDEQFRKDRLAGLMEALRYTADDARAGKPNPSKIPFDGDVRNNLASYRNAIQRYQTFLEETGVDELAAVLPEIHQQSFGLERDMQASLRAEIRQLAPGLVITDDGVERAVDSGFIDITARDAEGSTVVIELKAKTASREAVGQILSYMGDVAAEDHGTRVRGILIAADFDHKARAAARMVPELTLRKYSVRFTFSDGHGES